MEHTEAIVIKSIIYQEEKKIITLFSKEVGLFSLIVKGLSKNRIDLFSLTTPFCLGDFFYRKTNGEIWIFQEGKVIDQMFVLKENLSFLQGAAFLSKAIIDSQMTQKRTTDLYLLFRSYVKNIHIFTNLDVLEVSFLLKILIHDGLLHVTQKCNLCENEALFLQNGESLCAKHKNFNFIEFDKDEFSTIMELAYFRKFSDIQNKEITTSFRKKIEKVFNSAFK